MLRKREPLLLRVPRGLISRLRLAADRLLGMKMGRRNRMEGRGRCRRLSQIRIGELNAFSQGCWLWPIDAPHGGLRIQIGNRNYFNRNVMIDACGYIEIGSENMFGPDVYITDSNHRFETGIAPHSLSMDSGYVKIGNRCWVGAGAIILKDVELGDGCVIAAGAVVTRSYGYLAVCLKKGILRQGLRCPSCGSHQSHVIARKYVFTSLRRCEQCALLFRSPTTTPDESASFYQRTYKESRTTELPSEAEIKRLKQENFGSLSTSYLPYIDVLDALGAKQGQRILDFGCSWGYGSYQLATAGYEVEGTEISESRARYASSVVGVTTIELSRIKSDAYDIFFSAHVVEHVPSVSKLIELARRTLRVGGLFIAFTPNGSMTYRAAEPQAYKRSWGGVHPQLIDEEFLLKGACGEGMLVTSSPHPLRDIAEWKGASRVYSLDGHELMFAFRNNAI